MFICHELIRKFIKKGQAIHTYADEIIDDAANWMNTLPRKILDYQTPAEAFAKFVGCGARPTTNKLQKNLI